MPEPVEPELAELATAHGIAVRYRDSSEQEVEVDRGVVVDVLSALDVDATTPPALAAALAAVRSADPGRLPPTLVVDTARSLPFAGTVVLEDGGERAVGTTLPADLPVGYHRLTGGDRDVTVIVPPPRLEPPPPTWGWMVQLYALRSPGSWGCGDYADLASLLARTADEQGAGALLVNPLHALALAPRVEPSPYSPSSRRFLHPLYVRVEDTAAYAAAPSSVRSSVAGLRPASADLVDHDAVWAAKRTALELLAPYASSFPRDLDALDPEQRDVATWYALAERHGSDLHEWSADLQHVDDTGVAAARAELADRVLFHAWCLDLADAQLATAHEAAGGMAVGLIADLAVGCSAGGADAWTLAGALARGVTVGAPPDDFNQQGQDWALPPWRPDALAASGYAPLRSMIRGVLRHADGLRVDHVAGLWRLWWIPPGRGAREGAYVHYDARAMLAVVAIEASRAGAVVVGEDLGTVEREVTSGLADHGMLGCAVMWFQRSDDGALLPPRHWHPETLASVSTHDLPTAAGFLRDEHVRARAEAGVLTDVDAAYADAARDRAELLELLRAEGFAVDPSDPDAVVLAMHRLLATARSRIVLAAFTDVLGDVRQPNLPGTIDAYPNWRIPLSTPLPDLLADPRVRAVAAALGDRPM
ncbi:4-alpha-glucanotransferase [Actinomycetospora sp. NBRC 106375]|uniref:4-alpha-glucanotransferase n=1 Tax=Actinomycetospora sp. NBRC 106375 TaxID=3032207 RepID=UPI0024A1951C|nr:4-alpha-glucanotransferase [Actinomycetospora sp. NBRC 106375]GLZ49437.1 4-alpha-glucanotransferase [Actinomycetospora sp. NBRC 106375]